jgi:hypothetical protein
VGGLPAATGSTTPYIRLRAGRDGGEFVFPAKVLTDMSSTAKGIVTGNSFAQSPGLIEVPNSGLRGGMPETQSDGRGECVERGGGPEVVIAVDGPAASGKGTISKKLAQQLGLAHLDTGSLYRAVALRLLRKGKVGRNGHVEECGDGCVKEAAVEALAITQEDLCDAELRSEIVGQWASIVSAEPAVRCALLQYQRDFCRAPPSGTRGAVLDGRDIGTGTQFTCFTGTRVQILTLYTQSSVLKHLSSSSSPQTQRCVCVCVCVYVRVVYLRARASERVSSPVCHSHSLSLAHTRTHACLDL